MSLEVNLYMYCFCYCPTKLKTNPGWLGEWHERFPCFPSWGISVSKNIHVFCYTIIVTLVWRYVVILDVYYVLAEVCPQPSKIVADMHF